MSFVILGEDVWPGEPAEALEQKYDKIVQEAKESDCGSLKEKQDTTTVKQDRKHTTGTFVTMFSCTHIVSITELFISESLTQVYLAFLAACTAVGFPDVISYDDGCHFDAFKQSRSAWTEDTAKLAKCKVIIPEMHKKGHKCDSDKYSKHSLDELKDLDVPTEICESVFSWFSNYKSMARYMNRYRFILFVVRMASLHNESLAQRQDHITTTSGRKRRHAALGERV